MRDTYLSATTRALRQDRAGWWTPEPAKDAMHPLDARLKRGDAMLAVIKAARHWSRETSANGSPVDALKAASALHYAVINLDRVEANHPELENER